MSGRSKSAGMPCRHKALAGGRLCGALAPACSQVLFRLTGGFSQAVPCSQAMLGCRPSRPF